MSCARSPSQPPEGVEEVPSVKGEGRGCLASDGRAEVFERVMWGMGGSLVGPD